jgi:hypothetical protein
VAELARELFAEFADAYLRGDRPDASAFLERAGAEGDELAPLIERFLQGVPAPDALPRDAALLAAWLGTEPPLLELRRRQGLRVDEVVDRLGAALGIDAKRQPRLKWQYQRLEGGTLDPAGVAARVWQALAEIFAAPARDLVGEWRAPSPSRAAFLRAPLATSAASRPISGLDPDEEIDSLFAAANADS